MDALSTLAFDFPASPRAAGAAARPSGASWSGLLQNRRNADAHPRGSYAGAMELPRFMPTSVAKYAVDY
jgi:membrane-bound lytic murein transglycosylase B